MNLKWVSLCLRKEQIKQKYTCNYCRKGCNSNVQKAIISLLNIYYQFWLHFAKYSLQEVCGVDKLQLQKEFTH